MDRCTARLQRVVPQAMTFLEEQQALGHRRRENDHACLHFRIALPPDDPQVVVEERLHPQLSRVVGQRDQGEIELAAFQPQQQIGCQVLAQGQTQLGVARPQQRQRMRQQKGRNGRDDTEPEQPRHRLAGAGGDGHQILCRRQYQPRPIDHLQPDRRHQHRLPVPLHQLRAKYVLQFLQARAQRRLGDEAGFRRPCEIELLGEGDQIVQLLQRSQGCHGYKQAYYRFFRL